MNFDQLSDYLPHVLEEAIFQGAVESAPTLIAAQRQRIHEQSLDSSNQKIKSKSRDGKTTNQYSEKPYFSLLKDFVNRQGVPKKQISSTNRSVQLPEGYKSFREYNKRQTAKIDLELTGLMKRSYVSEATDLGFRTGFIDAAGGNDDTAANKAKWAEDRNGAPIWRATDEELQIIEQVILLSIEKALLV